MEPKLIIGGFDIGDYRDVSPRMVEAIGKSDLILVESLELFNKKCKLLGVTPIGKVIEYDYENQNNQSVLDDVIESFKLKKTVMITSDDGMPGVCDPGSLIIRTASSCNVKITTIPGPSILSTLPAMSGLNTRSFMFEEHLPTDKAERIKVLKMARASKKSFMFIIANRRGENWLLKEIFEDILYVYKKHAMVAVGIDITMPTEFFKLDTIDAVKKSLDDIVISDNTHISVFLNWVA